MPDLTVFLFCCQEHHLQRALSAQQVYGTAERLVIPIPEVEQITTHYNQLYKITPEYKPPKQFIHVQRMYNLWLLKAMVFINNQMDVLVCAQVELC